LGGFDDSGPFGKSMIGSSTFSAVKPHRGAGSDPGKMPEPGLSGASSGRAMDDILAKFVAMGEPAPGGFGIDPAASAPSPLRPSSELDAMTMSLQSASQFVRLRDGAGGGNPYSGGTTGLGAFSMPDTIAESPSGLE